MEQAKTEYARDYERCRAVWKRVAPQEKPYPLPEGEEEGKRTTSELTLPGAQEDPCCMGTEAELSIEVLQGFLREELGGAQVYAFLASRVPRGEAARLLRTMAEEERHHARDLAAAIYLITGTPYCPRVCAERPETGDFCALLRRLYHEEACGGYNYARAAEETLDVCLAKLFSAMSADEYRHAGHLMLLLGKYLAL